MNILLVDHDARRRGRLQRILRQGGHEVAGVADSPEALARLLATPHDVVIAADSARQRGGENLFRKLRSTHSPAQSSQPYLILVGDVPSPSPNPQQRKVLPRDWEADDLLSEPFRTAEVLARVDVARKTLERRREHAAQLKRIARIPANSPHPILEITAAGTLIHANLASMPLLEAWGWVAGRPAPPPLRHLAGAALAAGKQKRADIPCGERTYTFLATCLEAGDVCLYGSDATDLASAHHELGTLKGHSIGLALRDAQTGLPTQLLLGERVSHALTHARQAGTRVALVKVNVDNTTDINGTYGHSVGDQLILLVGECLRDEVRVGDTVFRDAGDGFVLLLQGVGSREAAGATCTRFIRAAQQAGDDADLGVRFTLSMGLALFPEDADSEQTLLERAEQALTEAKNAGRNCWRDYPAAVGANPMIGAERLLPRLMSALQSRQLHAQYQPIIAAQSHTVAGFEALVRWHDPDLGWIAPDRFIPLAEARGLIAEVGRQMADLVFRQLAVWRAAGHAVTVSLNISKRQLWEASFCEDLRLLAREHRLSPAWIILEATERQSLLHDRLCRETLERLALAGFRLSLDDFGSGHSTFDVVSELPLNELKINMTLSRKVQTPRGRHVVRAILSMCRDLGLDSVVEGIEDDALGKALQEIGATKLQGYLYSPPLAAEASLEFLARFPAEASVPKPKALKRPARRPAR